MTDAQADRANCVGARSRSGSGSRRSSRSVPSSSSRAAGGKGTIQSDSEIVPRIQARWPRISGASTTVSSGRLGAIRRAPRERLGGRDYIALARQEGRGDHGALAEARRESVDHPREPLAAHGVGIEEPELAHSRGSETPGRDADEAHRARHPLALQESARPAVELEPVLRRRSGSAPGAPRPPAQARSTGRGARRRAPPPAATATRPSGFSSSEATFATNLFDARPAEAVRHVSSRIRRLIARTASSALPKSPSVPVRSTNASSTDTGSTSGEKSASMPMTCTETARYFAMSTGRKAAWAQSLAARAIGIAERTPNRRASY